MPKHFLQKPSITLLRPPQSPQRRDQPCEVHLGYAGQKREDVVERIALSVNTLGVDRTVGEAREEFVEDNETAKEGSTRTESSRSSSRHGEVQRLHR